MRSLWFCQNVVNIFSREEIVDGSLIPQKLNFLIFAKVNSRKFSIFQNSILFLFHLRKYFYKISRSTLLFPKVYSRISTALFVLQKFLPLKYNLSSRSLLHVLMGLSRFAILAEIISLQAWSKNWEKRQQMEISQNKWIQNFSRKEFFFSFFFSKQSYNL